MSVTIGTFLYIIIGIFLIYKSKLDLKKIFLYFFCFVLASKLFMNIGYFIKIGDFALQYSEILTFITFIFGLIYCIKYGFDLKNFFLLFIVATIVFLSISLNYIIDYNEYGIPNGQVWDFYFLGRIELQKLVPTSSSFLQSIRIIIFIFNISVFLKLSSKDNIESFFNILYKISIPILVLIFIEIIMKNAFNSSALNDLYLTIFGSSDTQSIGVVFRNDGITIIGLFKEQSHLAIYFTILSIIFLIYWYYFDKKIVLFLSMIYVLITIMSMAFTSILGIVVYTLFLLYFVHKKKYRFNFLIYVTLGILIIGFIIGIYFSNYWERVQNSMNMILNFDENKTYEINSENIRIYNIMFNLKIFFRHPILGIGVGTTYCQSGIVTSLAYFGILGLVTYWVAIKKLFNNNNLTFPIVIFILTGLLNVFKGDASYLYDETVFIILFSYSIFTSKIVEYGN